MINMRDDIVLFVLVSYFQLYFFTLVNAKTIEYRIISDYFAYYAKETKDMLIYVPFLKIRPFPLQLRLGFSRGLLQDGFHVLQGS